MKMGVFTISLDFELFWGVRDHRTLKDYGENIRNVHVVVPRLLQLFEKYNVHCTWATVGFLFLKDKAELLTHLPDLKPDYLKPEYDPYRYINANELEKTYHFAPALIDLIRKTSGQEIGTHTCSHFYTLEKNTNPDQFKSDLNAAITIAKEKGIDIKSIVFPRNQYSDEHISVCRKAGIKVYRGNEMSGAYKPVSRENENIFRKGIRFADTYLNITGHHCHKFPASGDILNVPASRFLRPYKPNLRFFDGLKLNRIKKSMLFAANQGLIYQLWWHPHNFGKYMDENISFLEEIVKYYDQLNQEGKMKSQTLEEIYSNTINQ